MTDWLPIETAPKDGRLILLAFSEPYTPVIPGQWRESEYYDDDWWGWAGYDLHALIPPTHWMPLPAPPASGEQQ